MTVDKQKVMVLYSSPEAASLQTVTSWVSRTGQMWGKDEHMARFSGCTHVNCSICNTPVARGELICKSCRQTQEIAKYEALPRENWNGTTPLYSDAFDQFVFDPGGLLFLLGDVEDGQSRRTLAELRLLLCEPVMPSEIDLAEIWGDDLGEDQEPPAKYQVLIDKFNQLVRDETEPVSWSPTQIAINPESVATLLNRINIITGVVSEPAGEAT